ncbi:hypothetical protein L2E82_09177 [Cichorium intybus]|uniref:Uncharacterized protein n=1 Tax=Cichorium intybus TaxID=13427 RepID=A0ACB9G8B9_CICIN|nr:hypothetical protein L2E82_09177 [Cichorium intybus]
MIRLKTGVNAQKLTREGDAAAKFRQSTAIGNRTLSFNSMSFSSGTVLSYRMVVDNRYTKVAKGKSTLSKVLMIQAMVMLVGVLDIVFTLLKKEPLQVLAAASSSITLISIIIGELGRERSRVNLLKFYMVASSMGILGSILIGLGDFETHEFDLLKIAYVFAGVFLQIFSVIKTASLIGNMSPPKRAY